MAQGQSQKVGFARFEYVGSAKGRQGEEETRVPECYGLYDLLSRYRTVVTLPSFKVIVG